ncbi:MAG: hypothetical protein WB949_17595 [Candidatus Acidiferrales bacterium]
MPTAHNRSKLVLELAFAMFVSVIVLSAQSTPEAPNSPGDVVTKLWKSAADGNLLSVEGWKSTSGFFIHPSPPLEMKSFLVVSNDWSVGPVVAKADKAEVDVNYITAGKIAASLRYLPPPKTPYMKTGIAYHVVSAPPYDSTNGSEEKTGSAVWKIDDPRGPPWTTIDGAIRYVTKMRDRSQDPVIRKNADETLAKLAKLH